MVMGKVSTTAQFEDDWFRILRYRNPEIVERVLELYVAEYQRCLVVYCDTLSTSLDSGTGTPGQEETWRTRRRYYEMLLSASRDRDGRLYDEQNTEEKERSIGESEMEYQDLLVDVATTTFSGEIYPYVWSFPHSTGAHILYFTYVMPDRTIDLLLHARSGFYEGLRLSDDELYTSLDGGSMSVDDVLKVLASMAERNPGIANKRRSDILELTERYALFYKDVERGEARDYWQRHHALRIISRLGSLETAGSLLDSVLSSPPTYRGHRRGAENMEELVPFGVRIRELWANAGDRK